MLDIMLPSMTGLDILTKLRDLRLSPKFTPDHHVIILTNLDEDDATKKKIYEPAQGYYTKVNITPRKLIDIIKEMTGNISVHAAPSSLNEPFLRRL